VAPLTIIIRRRRHETDPITDRNAFRLCIDASDRDRLLDESKWSKHIVISDWYHLNPTASRRQVAGGEGGAVDGAAGASRDYPDQGPPVVDISAEAHDSTVLYNRDDNVVNMDMLYLVILMAADLKTYSNLTIY